MAMALVFSGRVRDAPLSISRHAAAWTFFLCGSWARPNALFAAVPLALYIMGPRMMGSATRWRRWVTIAAAAALVPAALWVGSQVLFYKLVHAKKGYAIHSIVTSAAPAGLLPILHDADQLCVS